MWAVHTRLPITPQSKSLPFVSGIRHVVAAPAVVVRDDILDPGATSASELLMDDEHQSREE
ncbi:MAG: hypothetical protein ABIR79_06000 [Candidatus Binatia bacterium]